MSRSNSELGSPVKSLGTFEGAESVPPLDLNDEGKTYFDRSPPPKATNLAKAAVQAIENEPATRPL